MRVSPQISVVMPSFQQVQFIEEAVRSVLNQDNANIELIVLDPGSKDGSRELLLTLKEEHGDSLKLVFEPDSGQSDAINKGLELASGEILCWLNSDDRFLPGTLEKVKRSLAGRKGAAWLYGYARNVDENGQTVLSFIAWYKKVRGRRFSRLKLLTEDFIPQMSTFWNREMWDISGGLNVDKHLDMDYDLWLKFSRYADPIVIDENLADFRIHGEAKGSTNYATQLDAAYSTARQYAPELGLPGKMALIVHWLFSQRTRFIYRFIKP